MTRTEPRERIKAWAWAVVAIIVWLLLAANSAEAQSVQVPEIVLAQVLGPNAPNARAEAPEPTSPPSVNLVAARMRAEFEDQLVAGVHRPSVELEVHFDFDSDAVHSESEPEIAAAAEVLTDHFPDTRFRVAGYTDSAGTAEYNQVLSERRARAVWERLVEEHGVSADRLELVGHGEEGSDDMTDAERRRVELQILR